MKKYFLTFASSNMKLAGERILQQAKAMNIYDEFVLLDETKLNKDFVEKFKDKLLPEVLGFGYWCWKPEAILQTLLTMEDNDILNYCDAGIHLNINGQIRLLEYFDLVEKSQFGILGFEGKIANPIIHKGARETWKGRLVCEQIKGDLLDYFGVRNDIAITHSPEIAASPIFIKKSKDTVNFFKEFIKVFETDFSLIDDTASKSPNLPENGSHLHDQAIFTLLAKKYKIDTVSTDEIEFPVWHLGLSQSDMDWAILNNYPFHSKRDRGFKTDRTEYEKNTQMQRKNQINELYKKILNRDADESGLQHYANSKFSINQIEEILRQSTEYKTKINATIIKNLYQFILQRNPTNEEIQNQLTGFGGFESLMQSFINSEEYQNLQASKDSELGTNIEKITYAITKIDNRAKDITDRVHNIMKSDFIYFDDITYIDGRKIDLDVFFTTNRNIEIDWQGSDIRKEPSKGELGGIASNVILWEHLVNSNLEELIIFEDDCELTENFVNVFKKCYKDLPEDYDFFEFFSSDLSEYVCKKTNKDLIIDSKYICYAFQDAHIGGVLYSKNGARKILDAYKKYGIQQPNDIFLFNLVKKGYINGYTAFCSTKLISNKDFLGTYVTERVNEIWSDNFKEK